MKEEFEKLVGAGKISRQQVDPLVQLAEAGFCMHRSWGFGKITAVDTVFARLNVDFQAKPGHTMDLSFAADSLKPISASHILARKISDMHGLRQTAALHHLELIKLVLESYGGKATLEQIQQVLVPDVITEDWKKWWEAAKKELKKDGHFQMPLKKTDPIVYQAQETSLQQRLISELRAAKGLKAKISAANEILRNLSDLSEKASAAQEAIAALNVDINSHQRTQPALALEAIFLRDELRSSAGLQATPGELDDKSIWAQIVRPTPVLEIFPAAKHKRALESYKEAHPDKWVEVLLGILNTSSSKLAGESAGILIQNEKLAELKEHLARLISQHQASSELLLWLAKERSDTFADILGPEVFRAMLTAMERDQFNEKRSNKLRDYILADQPLLIELIGSADLEVIKDLTRALQLSPCFDDMDKRSLLARIVKSYPAVQSLISGDQKKEDSTLLVSWESLERRKNEYNDLVQKKIPANSKEIAIARSYGDLRENHEYKAAKEMQKILMRRKGELEAQLVRARGFDFANAKTDTVNVGTRVQVTDLSNNHREAYSVLGAWDSDPEKGIISYLTPVAQCFLNRKVGDEVELEMDGSKKRYRIESIESVGPILGQPQSTESAQE
ncbi:MAG: GreA/GreB family elongation factor [Verrucomicrobiota bacterium]|nr:GreA/GreB family elongation factor [Verrucomicrobiota bacterium]